MGALNGGHCCAAELEFGLKLGSIKLNFEEEEKIGRIEDAVKTLLQGLGEDVNREGLVRTPRRVALAFWEGTRGYRLDAKEIVQDALFPEPGLDNGFGQAGGNGGLVVVQDLDLFSYCESCLLPFQVKCNVAYVPSGQRVVGLSKLSRVADAFAKRLQDPQRLADEICSALHTAIKPAGVAVVLECRHILFPISEPLLVGSKIERWAQILVSSGSGVFENQEADVWGELLSLLRLKDVNLFEIRTRKSTQEWCPFLVPAAGRTPLNFVNASSTMANAVDSIIRSLGENPRKELLGTPIRFLRWLIRFTSTNPEMKLNGFVSGEVEQPLKSNGEVGYNKKLHSALSLPFSSQCEHHLLPFHGVVHIGYYGVNPIGKSLLQSMVYFYGFKLQVQERLTRQIAEAVALLSGGDVMVVVDAKHTCMISRGIGKLGSHTTTVARLGRFSSEPGARVAFLQSLPTETPSYWW